MNEGHFALVCLLGGLSGHLLMRVSGDIGNAIRRFRSDLEIQRHYDRLSNRGEATTETKPEDKGGIRFDADQQKQVDFIVESRLKREREKFADYEDLKKFKSEYEKQQDAKAQKELEEQRKYEDAKKNYETQINQHKEILTKKEQEIVDLRISHGLINEITKQNGYAEETLALLKSSAVLAQDGSVVIKGKDANGFDTQLPVAEGVKRFLETRPYLVKSTHKAGGGTPPGAPPSTTGNELDHNALNKAYMEAVNRGDFKKTKELKQQINSLLASKGVSV